MRTLGMTFLALGLLGACRSEVPSPANVCFGQLNAAAEDCEDQMCVQKVQRLNVDGESQGGLSCSFCKDLPPEMLSTDQSPTYISVQLNGSSLVAFFKFDNRVTLDYTLENLQKYALTVNGWYTNNQGRMNFEETPFEVLGYDGEKLHVRFSTALHGLHYSADVLPYSCTVFNTPQICTKLSCDYSSEAPGGDGEPAELIAEVNVPISIGGF